MKYGIYNNDSIRVLKTLKARVTKERVGDFETSYDVIYLSDSLPEKHIIKIFAGPLEDDFMELLARLCTISGDSKLLFDFGHLGYGFNEQQYETTIQYFQIPIDQIHHAFSVGIPKEVFLGGPWRERELDLIGANLFFSESCKWSIAYAPIADWAMFAGVSSAATVFDQWQLRNDYSVQEFLQDQSDYGPRFRANKVEGIYDWPSRLMIHAYGKEKAIELMSQANLILG